MSFYRFIDITLNGFVMSYRLAKPSETAAYSDFLQRAAKKYNVSESDLPQRVLQEGMWELVHGIARWPEGFGVEKMEDVPFLIIKRLFFLATTVSEDPTQAKK